MSFRDHIVACNSYDPARVVPLFAGDERVGLKPGVMRRALAKLTAAARAHS